KDLLKVAPIRAAQGATADNGLFEDLTAGVMRVNRPAEIRVDRLAVVTDRNQRDAGADPFLSCLLVRPSCRSTGRSSFASSVMRANSPSAPNGSSTANAFLRQFPENKLVLTRDFWLHAIRCLLDGLRLDENIVLGEAVVALESAFD